MELLFRVVLIAIIAFCSAEDSATGVAFQTPAVNRRRDFYLDRCGESLSCVLDNGTLSVAGTGDMFNYSYDDPWIDAIKTVESVVIDDGVTSIGDYAFYNCRYLKNVVISNTVTSIGSFSFSLCTSLKNVNIPDSVTFIGSSAFASSALTSVVLPSRLTSIEDNVFSNCNSLKDVVIPDSVKSIGSAAFAGCNLTNITIPGSVRSLSGSPFANNPLKSVIISYGLTSIPSSVFVYSELEVVVIPESVTTIEDDAFHYGEIKTLFYQGSSNLNCSEYTFLLSPIQEVCVPPDFKSDSFCGQSVSNSDTCQSFQKQFSQCHKGTWADGAVTHEKWHNVTEWENDSTECVEYVCEEGGGIVNHSICYSTEDTRRICVNDKCEKDDSWKKGEWQVEIEYTTTVRVTDIDVNEYLEELSSKCGISKEDMVLGVETDADGFIIKIIVDVPDEDKARSIERAFESGLLFRDVKVQVKARDSHLSSTSTIHDTISVITVVLFSLYSLFSS